MRKVVCNTCGEDWQIQHCCRAGFGNTHPTVIYEPEPIKSNKEQQKILLSSIIEKSANLRYTLSVDSDISVGHSWELEEILELLYKLEKDLE